MQVAWVTSDLELAMKQFKELYGIPEFYVLETQFDAEVRGEQGQMHLQVALANVDNVQLELIRPLGSSLEHLYRDSLPSGGGGPVFHHICVQVHGDLAAWDAYYSKLSQERSVIYMGKGGPGVRFVYTDERETLGMYLEHVWFSPEHAAALRAKIPTYHTGSTS
jgi:hypothetical protein